jgi:hypothetical protein
MCGTDERHGKWYPHWRNRIRRTEKKKLVLEKEKKRRRDVLDGPIKTERYPCVTTILAQSQKYPEKNVYPLYIQSSVKTDHLINEY